MELSLKDGMQVDLKSECFTPESRPNKDFARDSLNSNWPKCTGKLSNLRQKNYTSIRIVLDKHNEKTIKIYKYISPLSTSGNGVIWKKIIDGLESQWCHTWSDRVESIQGILLQ